MAYSCVLECPIFNIERRDATTYAGFQSKTLQPFQHFQSWLKSTAYPSCPCSDSIQFRFHGTFSQLTESQTVQALAHPGKLFGILQQLVQVSAERTNMLRLFKHGGEFLGLNFEMEWAGSLLQKLL